MFDSLGRVCLVVVEKGMNLTASVWYVITSWEEYMWRSCSSPYCMDEKHGCYTLHI